MGCGSSLGAPWINNYWGSLNQKNVKNIRTRCCAHIFYNDLSILIDTSPDIKKQIIDNKIKNVDAIVYTHEHADQTVGIFELRPFFWKNQKKIDVFGSKRTIKALHQKYTFTVRGRLRFSGLGPTFRTLNSSRTLTVSRRSGHLPDA